MEDTAERNAIEKKSFRSNYIFIGKPFAVTKYRK